MSSVSILILDDNREMRALIRGALLGFGFRRIVEANDAEAAMALISRGGLDIAIVDYRLGVFDGARLCREVRGSPDRDTHFLPIIMVTGYAERTRIREAVDSGVDEYLVKPVTAAGLASRINAVIERRRPFVRAPGYFGPDRRRRIDPGFSGPFLRFDDDTELVI